jgi:hypothetical protein
LIRLRGHLRGHVQMTCATGRIEPLRRLQLEQPRSNDPKHHEQHRGAKKVCVIDDNSCCLRHDKSTDEFYGEITGVG